MPDVRRGSVGGDGPLEVQGLLVLRAERGGRVAGGVASQGGARARGEEGGGGGGSGDGGCGGGCGGEAEAVASGLPSARVSTGPLVRDNNSHRPHTIHFSLLQYHRVLHSHLV